MTKTGPQQYPGASLAYDYSRAYPGDSMESNVICLHSTEGTSVPTYGGGSSAPNFTVAPDFGNKRAQWYQHFDFDESSRALVNSSGGVETNTMNVCQIEIVGTCDPSTHKKWTDQGIKHLFTPELPEWFKDELAEFIAWANKNHGVKIQSGLTFKAYPGSYGSRSDNGVRMTNDQWLDFYGVCGHQHVPENVHGDPGNIDIDYILSKAKTLSGNGGTKPPTTYEPFPGAEFFYHGHKSPIVKACRDRLIAEGCNKYQSTSDQDVWGSGDEASYSAWQKKLGYTGSDADGTPGKTSWDKLKVPNV